MSYYSNVLSSRFNSKVDFYVSTVLCKLCLLYGGVFRMVFIWAKSTVGNLYKGVNSVTFNSTGMVNTAFSLPLFKLKNIA